MKLDRNLNRDGGGKYALVNMRKLAPVTDRLFTKNCTTEDIAICDAVNLLRKHGIISAGNETPGDQFFVMKYKDQFTAPALQAYTDAIKAMLRYAPQNDEQRRVGSELSEYALQMQGEADAARKLGNRIPD